MCKRNSPDKNEANSGCVREIPRIKMKPEWVFKRKSADQIKANMRGVKKKKKKKNPQIKMKPARDV